MKDLIFKSKPTFAELWDACVYNLMYVPSNKYISDIKSLFTKLGITKKSNILDVSAGTGFPAIELSAEGFKLDCMDAMQDEIDVFHKKAKALNLDITCSKLTWLEIPLKYKPQTYDAILCRGNSFIYAAGGWNKNLSTNSEKCLQLYEKTLKIFYNTLSKDGVLYIDKFKDSETPNKTKVATIKISQKKYDLIFWTEVMPSLKKRQASMLLRDEKGIEKGLPNETYLLSKPELINLLEKVGFSKIQEIKLTSETHFDILIAKKSTD